MTHSCLYQTISNYWFPLLRFPLSSDSTRIVRGKLATSDKPLTFNQAWTVEEQVCHLFKARSSGLWIDEKFLVIFWMGLIGFDRINVSYLFFSLTRNLQNKSLLRISWISDSYKSCAAKNSEKFVVSSGNLQVCRPPLYQLSSRANWGWERVLANSLVFEGVQGFNSILEKVWKLEDASSNAARDNEFFLLCNVRLTWI